MFIIISIPKAKDLAALPFLEVWKPVQAKLEISTPATFAIVVSSPHV